MKTILAFFKCAPEDLFRVAKRRGPSLASALRVRQEPVTHPEPLKQYDVIVSATGTLFRASGGISLFNTKNPRLRGNDNEWWVLEEGKALPEGLTLLMDEDKQGSRHYLIAPAWDMHLSHYKELLAATEPLFINYLDYIAKRSKS
jgi:hypothetical protein